MKKLFTILLVLLAFSGVKANDGAFYAEGNQLIPITETTIRVQKKILTITLAPRVEYQTHRFKVNVYYEFYNPGEAKGLQRYFESTQWYIPDPSYKSDMSTMSTDEKNWIKYWSK